MHVTSSTEEIYKALQEFLLTDLLQGEVDELDRDTPLLETNLLDSIGLVRTLVFVEARFDVRIPDSDVTPEHFRSLGTLSRHISRLAPLQAGSQEARSIHDAPIRALELYGIQRGRVAVGDASIHHLRVEGPGPTWVMIPALGNASSSWGGMLRAVKGEHEAIAFDQLGFGLSHRPGPNPRFADHVESMLGAIDALTQGPIVLFGNSAGAMVAAEIARQRPEKVKALVVTSIAALPDPEAFWRDLARLTEDLEEYLRAMYFRPPFLSDTLRTIVSSALSCPAYTGFLDELGRERLPRLFEGVRAPTLFVCGQADRVIPRADVIATVAAMPSARLEWLPRCGHYPQTERPQELLLLVDLFLGGLEGGAR